MDTTNVYVLNDRRCSVEGHDFDIRVNIANEPKSLVCICCGCMWEVTPHG